MCSQQPSNCLSVSFSSICSQTLVKAAILFSLHCCGECHCGHILYKIILWLWDELKWSNWQPKNQTFIIKMLNRHWSDLKPESWFKKWLQCPPFYSVFLMLLMSLLSNSCSLCKVLLYPHWQHCSESLVWSFLLKGGHICLLLSFITNPLFFLRLADDLCSSYYTCLYLKYQL